MGFVRTTARTIPFNSIETAEKLYKIRGEKKSSLLHENRVYMRLIVARKQIKATTTTQIHSNTKHKQTRPRPHDDLLRSTARFNARLPDIVVSLGSLSFLFLVTNDTSRINPMEFSILTLFLFMTLNAQTQSQTRAILFFLLVLLQPLLLLLSH